jgi:hypothetical protein
MIYKLIRNVFTAPDRSLTSFDLFYPVNVIII